MFSSVDCSTVLTDSVFVSPGLVFPISILNNFNHIIANMSATEEKDVAAAEKTAEELKGTKRAAEVS